LLSAPKIAYCLIHQQNFLPKRSFLVIFKASKDSLEECILHLVLLAGDHHARPNIVESQNGYLFKSKLKGEQKYGKGIIS